MMCFRDRTFCNFYKDCSRGPRCLRALTPQVIAEAEAWWGASVDVPICLYVDKPKCWVAVDKTTDVRNYHA